MDSLDYRRRLGRLAGLTALVLAALFMATIFLGAGNVLHRNPDSATALAYSAQHAQALVVLGFGDGVINTLLGILLVMLIAISTLDGVVARIAYVTAGAAVALQWAHAGMLYALADLAHRGGADGGVLALFTLGSTMDESDGIVISIAMVCTGWLLLRSRRAPAFVGWLTIAMAAVGAAPTILAGLGGPDLGPVSVISGWIWLLGIGITFMIRPTSSESEQHVRASSPATV